MLVDEHASSRSRRRPTWILLAGGAATALVLLTSGFPPVAASPDDAISASPKEQPSAKAQAEDLQYSGTVQDKATHQPIPGATITVFLGLHDRATRNYRVLQETTHVSDADGSYRLQIPAEATRKSLSIELDIEHPEYVPATRLNGSLGAIREDLARGNRPFFETIEMRPGRAITGQVLEPDGAPARDVEVRASSRAKAAAKDPHESGGPSHATTDAEGRFRLVVATPGTGLFSILPAAFAPQRHEIPPDPRGDLGVFRLKPGVVVKGRVLDTEGKPLPGVFVNTEPRMITRAPDSRAALGLGSHTPNSPFLRRSTRTDAEGRFSLAPLPEGTHLIRPEQWGDTGGRWATWSPTPPGVFLRPELVLKEGEPPAPLEMRALPQVVIEVRWLDSKGSPTYALGTGIIGELGPETWGQVFFPNAGGKTVIPVPRGLKDARLPRISWDPIVYRYRMSPDGPLLNSRSIDFGTADRDLKGIEIVRFRVPVLRVKVQTAGGQPVPGATLSARYVDPDAGPANDAADTRAGRDPSQVELKSQPDGRWNTVQLQPDSAITLNAQADKFRPSSQTLTLPEGREEDVVLTLEPR